MKFRFTIADKPLRTNLIKGNFYEDIVFENEETSGQTEKIIENWIVKKQIKIEKFKDLFGLLEEIVFPIRITKVRNSRFGGFNIHIIDNEDKKYYMSRRPSYECQEIYIIGRGNSLLEPLINREFYYQICEDGTVLLKETGAMKLKQDGTDDDIVVDFYFNDEENTTEAVLKSFTSENKIKLKYPTRNFEFDKKVLEILFHINENWYFYDVFPILKSILEIMPKEYKENSSLSIIAEIDEDIYSEVDVLTGTVQRYTKAEVISEGEIRITKIICAKKLEEFLVQNS